MILKKLSLVKNIKKTKGTIILIDVFRAFSNLCSIKSRGAKRILLVESNESALEMKKRNPSLILIGETGGIKIDGFDFGNSPFEIDKKNFKGKTVVLKTSAGTRGAIEALNYSDEIYLTCFLNVNSTIKEILYTNPEEVNIVALGNQGNVNSIEDESCADYIINSIRDQQVDFEKIKEKIINSDVVKVYYNSDEKDFPEEDLDYCLRENVFNFVFKVKKRGNLIEV